MSDDLVKRLRAEADRQERRNSIIIHSIIENEVSAGLMETYKSAADGVAACVKDLREAADAIERLQAQCRRYEARLEIDHHFQMADNGELVRVEVPLHQRECETDGIDCRDETIKIQNEVIVKFALERDAAWAAGAQDMRERCAELCMAKQQTWVDGKMTSEIMLPYETDMSRRIRFLPLEPAKVKS